MAVEGNRKEAVSGMLFWCEWDQWWDRLGGFTRSRRHPDNAVFLSQTCPWKGNPICIAATTD